MKLHLEAEATAELLRQRLERNPDFDLHKAFSDLDLDRNGYITLEEFASLLDFHGIGATSYDVERLMQRYDKNKDGKVSYGDFLEELRPHSPLKYGGDTD